MLLLNILMVLKQRCNQMSFYHAINITLARYITFTWDVIVSV